MTDDKKRAKKIGPISRDATLSKHSVCYTMELDALDWLNWWQDDGYIHVRHIEEEGDETWHRVFPKGIGGRVCKRVMARDGKPVWLHDKQEEAK